MEAPHYHPGPYWSYWRQVPVVEGTAREISFRECGVVVVETYEGGIHRYRYRGVSLARLRVPSRRAYSVAVLAMLIPFILVALMVFSALTGGLVGFIGLPGVFGVFPLIFVVFVLVAALVVGLAVLQPARTMLVVLDDAGIRHYFVVRPEDEARLRFQVEKAWTMGAE